MKELKIGSLNKAINILEKSISITLAKKAEISNLDEIDVLIAGTIQSFEYTYELSWKLMKRWLENNISPNTVDGVTRRELFRQAAENRLIVDVDAWMEFHQARNDTSHVYDEEIATDVFKRATEFLPYAKDLLIRLEEKI